MLRTKRGYIIATASACIFIASLLTFLGIEYLHYELILEGYSEIIDKCPVNSEPQVPIPDHVNLYAWTVIVSSVVALTSAISTISAIILAWKSERRNAREQALRIEQLEKALEEAKKQVAIVPTTKAKKANKMSH